MTDPTNLLITINPSSGIPVYRQLMDQIKFLTASGVLRAGSTLPSTRTLSVELGVNPMTISKAYSYLQQEGIVERRPGRPLIVATLTPVRAGEERLKQLREVLASSITVVRQLGIAPEEATKVFVEMLDEESSMDPEDGGKS
jgi:GntR family transcriptional regulator